MKRLFVLKMLGDTRDYGYFEDKPTAKNHRKDGFYVALGPDHWRYDPKRTGYTAPTHKKGGKK